MELKEALQAGNIVVIDDMVGIIMSNNMIYYNKGCFDSVEVFKEYFDTHEEFYIYKVCSDTIIDITELLESGVVYMKYNAEYFEKVFKHKKLTLENIEYNKEYRAKDEHNNDLIIKKINMMERDYIISLTCNDGIYLDEYIERIDKWTDIKNIEEIKVEA